MVDKNEDVILNISNMTTKKNIELKTNEIPNYSNIKNNKAKKKSSLYKENKNKDNFYSIDEKENELFKNSPNYTNHKNIGLQNESIYPIKIKKMAKTDIIIKEDDCKKNNYILHNSSTDYTDIENKIIKGNTNTKNNDINKYICDICKKVYRIKNSFQKHLITHEKKKYICTNCNARFSVFSKLKRHLLIHSDKKDFKCPLCNIAFNLKYNLKVHMRIHNNEKPYICGHPGCFAKFAQLNNLTTHSKTHNNLSIKEEKEKNILLNFHENIIKFNSKTKKLNTKLSELNKIALNYNKINF